MNKHELNQIIFWMQELEELQSFKNMLNTCSGAKMLIHTNISFLLKSHSNVYTKEYELTDLQQVTLHGFLSDRIKHLNKLLESVDPESKELAKDILSGKVGKDALGI